MRSLRGSVVVLSLALAATLDVSAQTPAPQSGGRSDVYHVHFTKAVPGQADALAKALLTPDPKAPMPDHFMVLRHQEGDSWDYVVIQHLGAKPTVDPSPTANPARDLRAWHNDTFVSGPPWAEFAQAMGLGGTERSAGMVYIVGVHRPVPGHRDQLEKALSSSGPSKSKIQPGNMVLQHIEGGDWIFLSLTRYNSWQDLATERAEAAANPSATGGWADVRQHSDFHRDTIADRIYPSK